MLKLSAVIVTYFSSALGFQWLPAYGHLGHSHEGGSQSNQGGLTARTTPDVRDLDHHNKTLYKNKNKEKNTEEEILTSLLFPSSSSSSTRKYFRAALGIHTVAHSQSDPPDPFLR